MIKISLSFVSIVTFFSIHIFFHPLRQSLVLKEKPWTVGTVVKFDVAAFSQTASRGKPWHDLFIFYY